MAAVIFSGGPGCSGTGVLRRALGQHKDIATIPKELRLLVDPDGILPFLQTVQTGWSPINYDRAVTRLEMLLRAFAHRLPVTAFVSDIQRRIGLDRLLGRNLLRRYVNFDLAAYCPDYERLVDALIDQLTAFRYQASWEGMPFLADRQMRHGPARSRSELLAILRDFIERFAISVATAQGKRVYLDGNDWNVLWFDQLRELVPGSKIVCILRDPRDMTATHMRRRYAPSDLEQAAQYVRDIMNRWWCVRDALPPDDFIEVTLEDLVDNKEATLRRACLHFGIDWDPATLAFDVGGNNTGRWRREVPEQDHDHFLSAIGDLVERMGYR